MHSSWRSHMDTLRALGLILALGLLWPKAFAEPGERTIQVRDGFEMVFSPSVRPSQRVSLYPEPGRAVTFDWVRAVGEAPTFLFMPGLGFTMPIDHAAYTELSRQGFGIVAMNFSTHAPSVTALGNEESPYFLKRPPTATNFADEVNAVAAHLRANGVEVVIPVSLSYSGMVSARLSEFPLIVETAPLTSARAAASTGESIRASLELMNMFNPFRTEIVRRTMDAVYRNYWNKAVTEVESLTVERRANVIEAYMAMSRISEGYDADKVEYARGPRRIFVLGSEERVSLLNHQRRTVWRLRDLGYDVQVTEIPGASHLVANQVDAFVRVLSEAGRALDCATALRP